MQGSEAVHRWVECRVHLLVVGWALPLLRPEVDLAEAIEFFALVHARGVQFALDRIHAIRLHFLPDLGAFIVGLERLSYLFAVVHEVEHERILFERVDSVKPRKRLHRLDARQTLVHEHRMQQRLVEAGLVLLGHQQNLVLRRCEPLRQFLLRDALIHPRFGVRGARNLVVPNLAREGNQSLDRIALLPNVLVKRQLVAHGLEPGAGHHHRLRPPADLVARHRLKMLDHDLRLLGHVVRMHLEEPG